MRTCSFVIQFANNRCVKYFLYSTGICSFCVTEKYIQSREFLPFSIHISIREEFNFLIIHSDFVLQFRSLEQNIPPPLPFPAVGVISIRITPNNLIFGSKVQNCSCNYSPQNFSTPDRFREDIVRAIATALTAQTRIESVLWGAGGRVTLTLTYCQSHPIVYN